MATPNYGYEKRQRELAKKQKKEDKLRAKAQRRSDDPEAAPTDEDAPLTEGASEAGGATGG